MNTLRKIINRWRNFKLKKRSPKMIYGYINFEGRSIYKTAVSNSCFIDYPQNFQLGEGVYIGHYNFLEASNDLIIEEGCQITNFVTITTHSSHDSIRLYGKKYGDAKMKGYQKGPIHIGKYTFIGPYSTLMPNTTIGKGCLISAYSYVQGVFPDFSIIAGNPAKVIGDTRHRDHEILDEFPELKENYNEWINSN
jgi:acetyltransferase-like isoleucine patch superfamily enzyme